jgi:hypothetical protein
MTDEAKAYKNIFESFLTTVRNAFVTGIIYDIDSNPTFDVKNIPFDFLYCYSVSLITDKGNFRIHTSMTSEGVDSLWVLQFPEIDQTKSYISIESQIKTIAIKQGIDNLPCKMSITFETKSIFLYAGEIYDRPDNNFAYKINDEMILVFNDEKEALIFENLSN